MVRRIALALFWMCVVPRLAAADVTLDMSTAQITIDQQGYLAAMKLADGAVWPAAGQPAFSLETDKGIVLPTLVRRAGEDVHVDWEDGSKAVFALACQPGFALFRLKSLDAKSEVRRLNLFTLALPPDAELAAMINAGLTDEWCAAVMAAEPNVQPVSALFGSHKADREGCSHEFVRTEEAKAGRFAARFTATCNEKPAGWAMRGRIFPKRVDLTGCKALRAWVYGDGKGESLKIQMSDDRSGYRDDYITIDFEGWRQVELTKPALNSLHYDRVATLSFYYNSMPADQALACLIDQVEAVVERDGKEQIVVLEDFESLDSPLWSDSLRSIGVRTLEEHGVEPAAFGVIVCPKKRFYETVARFETAAKLASPRLGGVWNKQSPWVKRSYFFLTGFAESQFDEALAIARRGNFDMILLVQSSWCESTGHYEINRKSFPDGLEGLKRTAQRFRDAGLKFGLHFLGPSIYPPDPYLTPVPDPRLVKDASALLAADVDAEADFIPTAAAPSEFPAEDGGYTGSGAVLQVGDELILYAARSMEAPFGFRECRRGYLGTKAAAHKKGDKVAHLLKSYGYFLFDMDTSLLDEVSTNFARVANACDIDMIYFDGSERLQGDHWYYNAKLHKAFYDKLNKKDALLQASSTSHYSWHALARNASADGHGDLKGYLDERSPGFLYLSRNAMPLDIGWYYGYDTSATPDMFEYVLGATIGYDSSMSFQVSPAAAAAHPFTGELLDLIARYEKLRLSGRVPAEMKTRLRVDPILGGQKEPEVRAKLLDRRREYRLLDTDDGQVFQRVVYDPWREVAALDGKANVWPVEVSEGPARIGVQIQAQTGPWLGSGPSYDSPEAIVLETFDDLAPYTKTPEQEGVYAVGPGEAGSVLPGVRQWFESTGEDARVGGRCGVYTAESSLESKSGWSVVTKAFRPPLDLSKHKAIGLWFRGDGAGGAFKLQFVDGRGATDHYIQNDFTGWRYQQLARPEKDPIDYSQVRAMSLYYNGLPAKTKVSCGIDDVKALPALDERCIRDPYVEFAGKRFQWTGSLAEGQYLILWPGESLTRYGLPLTEPETAAAGVDWEMPAGKYEAKFGCTGTPGMPVRVRITAQPGERHRIP